MKSIALGLLILLLMSATTLRAQVPAWQLAAVSGTDAGYCTTAATATDASGDVYLAGTFGGSAQFGSITLVSAGNTDGFVAKWSSVTSSYAWAVALGGSAAEQITTLAVTATGLYVGGDFWNGTTVLGNTVFTQANNPDGFVAKLTESGTGAAVVWTQRMGGPIYDHVYGVAASGGNVYVAGTFESAADFGSTRVTSPGGLAAECFLTRLTDAGASGSFAWVTTFGSRNDDLVGGVAVRGNAVYVAGGFIGTATLGSLTLTSADAVTADAFVVKLTDAGSAPTYEWAQRAGGTGNDYARGLALGGSDLYVVGSIQAAATFGSTAVPNAGGSDGFVARLTDAGTSGSFGWATSFGGAGDDAANAVTVRDKGVYVAGRFAAPGASFGPLTLTSAGQTDAFVARLTNTGPGVGVQWAQQAGGANADNATSVALGPTGRVYLGGDVSLPARFGSFSFSATSTMPKGFLASLTDLVPTAATAAATPAAPVFYPNPARATVQVPAATAATTLTLLDASGRLVRTALGATLSVLDVAPGLYLLRAATPGQPLRTARLVVE